MIGVGSYVIVSPLELGNYKIADRVFTHAQICDKALSGSLRERLYGTYASQDAGCSDGEAAALIYLRYIRSALPPPAGPILDIGCGQRHLVKLMLADGYDVAGIDVSPEQLALARAVGLDQIQQGDYRLDIPRTCAAIA